MPIRAAPQQTLEEVYALFPRVKERREQIAGSCRSPNC